MDHTKAMDDFEHYKELYQIENDRRDSVNESLSLPVAIATGLLSFLFYLVTAFDYTQTGCNWWVFVVMSAIGLVLLMVSVFYLIRAFNNITAGFEYKGLPYPKALFDHRRKLQEYYAQHGNGETEANEKFIEYLTEKFAEHADHNMQVNDRKMRNIFRAKRFMVFSLVGISLACFPFGCNFFNRSEPTTRVEIVKMPEAKEQMEKQELPQQQSQLPQTNGRQGERPDTAAATPAPATGQARQRESRADSNQHRAR